MNSYQNRETPQTEQKIVLTVANVVKYYESGGRKFEVLKKIHFSAVAGKMYAIMGPSGAGKSTFLNVIGGLDRFDSGSIRVFGQELFGLRPAVLAQYRNRHIGFVFQAHNLLAEFSAQENVAMPLRIRRRSRREALATARAILEEVGLGHRMEHRPSELSGGECQRVSVARALVTDPSLILADEPTGNLDQENSEHLMSLLLDLQRKRQKTVILVTHDASLAARADSIYQMVDGAFAGKELTE